MSVSVASLFQFRRLIYSFHISRNVFRRFGIGHLSAAGPDVHHVEPGTARTDAAPELVVARQPDRRESLEPDDPLLRQVPQADSDLRTSGNFALSILRV